MKFTPASVAVALGGVASVAVAVWRLGGTWALIPFLALAAVGTVLAWIDLRSHRLPNRILLPAVAASVVVLLAAALADGAFERWITALLGGAALFGLYLVLALISPAGMGMGDVKLAALLGLFAGYLGLTTWLVAAFAGFLIGAVAALVAVALRRAKLSSSIPFGPWMIAGLWLAVGAA